MIGVLPLDKPAGPTSHDMVALARRALGERRIGHTGTLDPFASGLLLLCIGPATRLAEFLSDMDKEYEATARIGTATDTLDPTGEVLASSDEWQTLDEATIRRAFEAQRGERLQTPPAYSAKKVGGRKAYEMARRGDIVDLDPVPVVIHDLTVSGIAGPTVRFRIRCSSGTYVRAIARDAGQALDVGAHLVALRRTAIGPFGVADAVAAEDLQDGRDLTDRIVSPLEALAGWPRRELSEAEAARVRHGQPLPAAADAGPGLVALAAAGRLVAVAESDGATVRPRKVFA